MQRGLTGHFVPVSTLGEQCRAFVPAALPPSPALALDETLHEQLQNASLAIGRLDGQVDVLPDRQVFLYSYVRKEAVLSSQIEGTQSSLNDLLTHEMDLAPGVPLDDVTEVSCYVSALELGMQRLAEGMPISLRLISELHGQLLSSGRGSTKQPGEFRRSQNWIGGSRPGNALHVPPPPDMVQDCMGSLEKFIHNDPVKTGTLIKAALAHLQFETIHPFLDGNGRLGRLLIALILSSEGMLRQPMLYLSLYFKKNRAEYYAHLQQVRETGDWEAWLSYFLRGVKETADDAALTARRLWTVFREDRAKLQTLSGATGSLLQAHEQLQRVPLLSAGKAAIKMNVTLPTATKALQRLQTLGIVREITGGKYGRLYSYEAYLSILSEGTEPLR
ncbi:Fic family protein [Prosthecobacter sp.]|uniref:Fic family protein n=1 Tax=Prosthecobacter sp. TaxID=1965333 RepID=UPI00378338C0